jgi:hypothetical protein
MILRLFSYHQLNLLTRIEASTACYVPHKQLLIMEFTKNYPGRSRIQAGS